MFKKLAKIVTQAAPAAAGFAAGSMATGYAAGALTQNAPQVISKAPELISVVGIGGGVVGLMWGGKLIPVPKQFWLGMVGAGLLTGVGLGVYRVTKKAELAASITPGGTKTALLMVAGANGGGGTQQAA